MSTGEYVYKTYAAEYYATLSRSNQVSRLKSYENILHTQQASVCLQSHELLVPPPIAPSPRAPTVTDLVAAYTEMNM